MNTDIKLYQVGGSVRDALLGLPHHDIDYVMVCPSFESMKEYLLQNNYEIFVEKPEYGCIKARQKGQKKQKTCDFVMSRKDGYYSDNRRPDSIKPADLQTDLSRRDFTINAIALDENGNYIDVFGGIQDLKDRRIRCVGNAQERIFEDPLRGIRAIRFAITKEFTIDSDIMEIITSEQYSQSLASISKERIQVEVNKMFSHNVISSIKLLSKMPDHLLHAVFDKIGMKIKTTFK